MQTKRTPKVVLESKTAEFVKAVESAGGPPIYKLPIPDARKLLNDAQATPPQMKAADIEEHTIEAGPNGKLQLTIVRPAHWENALPAVMFFHGGGWILGNFKTHERLVRELAVGADVAVVFVNFTPSPEAHFPVAIEEAYAATKYVAEHTKDFRLQPDKFTVCGDSVGGNMAIAVTKLAKERGGPAISKQVLFYPVTDASLDSDSYSQFEQGPWLTKPAMEWFWNAYAPEETQRKSTLCSPLQSSLDELKGLPPALVITAENDVLRDEGEAYAHKLLEAGVEVSAVRYLGTIHDFVMLNGLATTPATRAAIALTISSLRAIH